jgi:hypothetical protein
VSVTIELGFTADGQGAPFFTLNNSTLGVLDSSAGLLGGGEVFVDVSQYFSTYSLTRGKSRELDRFQAGQASITFQNNQRTFDPTYEPSPIFGQVVPKRQLRITNGSVIQFQGVVEDWNINYEPGGQSIATCQAFDNFSYLSGLNLNAVTYPEELTGSRINGVLDTIGWSETAREIDAGQATVAAETITDEIAALSYFQTVSTSEPGEFFIAKNGYIKFVDRNQAFATGDVIFGDDGVSIPYKTISVVYGSELLYNNVIITSPIGTKTASNATSVQTYGARDLEQTTLLSTTEQLEQLAIYLVNKYKNPELRFENITIDIRDLSITDKPKVLGLELGEIVKVNFTPNGLSPAIERFGKIIGITQAVTPGSQEITFGLESTAGAVFVLNDALFGRLNEDNGLGW